MQGADGILRLGDRGEESGNDFELLASGLSLSVDGVSAALDQAWDAPPFDGSAMDRTLGCLRALQAREKRGLGFAETWLAGFERAHLESLRQLG